MIWQVCAFYRFTSLCGLPALREAVKSACLENEICGTILLAPEGINGTIGAPDQERLNDIMGFLDQRFGILQGEVKYSTATEKPFDRLKVRLKREIVTLKAPEADPSKKVGIYVEPERWNTIISDPDTVLIDTRNGFEVAMGKFPNALDPATITFSQFKDFVANTLDPSRDQKIAMYCTGGIRCEKASSYLLAHGFKTVYHLKGGILKYLETIPPDQSLWQGDCFVFDKRVALKHGLEESDATRP